MNMLKKVAAGAALVVFGVVPVTSSAQAVKPYPDKPVRLIVPWPAGNSADTVARHLADRLQQAMGQPFIVENKAGAGATIGTEFVAKATPDGYTLLVTNGAPIVVVPAVRSHVRYDSAKDFSPIAVLGHVGGLLVVNNDLPVRNLKEFIAYAKANPGKLSHGSTGKGSFGHLAMERFKKTFGVDMVHVPFQGDVLMLGELRAGRIDVAIGSIAVSGAMAKEGTVRAIATPAEARSPFAPSVPTIDEVMGGRFMQGLGDGMWLGVLAPARTPQVIVDRLSREMNSILRTPQFKTALEAQSLITAQPSTPKAFRATIDGGLDLWSRIAIEARARDSD